ncbi:hypothetical protein CsatB_017271 [Cannabis sativa]|uniref:Uncharacterized protein n=1 Tax=Cannabis sativa TaxID=3483 RepID=A0A803R650_CANSA
MLMLLHYCIRGELQQQMISSNLLDSRLMPMPLIIIILLCIYIFISVGICLLLHYQHGWFYF